VLGVDTVPLTHLRWMSEDDTFDGVSFDSAFDTMLEMQAEGRIEHIGLSNVTLDQLRRARARGTVATVSNRFGYGNQSDTPTLEYCTENDIPYLPFTSRDPNANAAPAVPGLTAKQARLAWLLARSPVAVVITGTSSVEHLEENLAAGENR
jgi:hypothetical protein